ncbi:MAG: hypothetical protein Q9218_007738 [Villophora microphyllina]
MTAQGRVRSRSLSSSPYTSNNRPRPTSWPPTSKYVDSRLDPRVWSKVPPEIVCLIIELCDRETLINWSCTNCFFYDVASDVLWETINLRPHELMNTDPVSNAWRGFRGEDYAHVNKQKRADGTIIHLLANEGFRRPSSRRSNGFRKLGGRSPKPPGVRVKGLRLAFLKGVPFEKPNTRVPASMTQRYVTAVTRNLLPLVPNLIDCTFEGPLHQLTFSLLTKLQNLRKLDIRRGLEFVQPAWEDMDADVILHELKNQLLNFCSLSFLTQLRILRIGRLVPKEAQGLAEAVSTLTRVTSLSISTSPAASNDDDRLSFAGSCSDESPILLFLKAILQCGCKTSTSARRHLPDTLTDLTLKDDWRVCRSTNTNILLDTISPCSRLYQLEIRLMDAGLVSHFLAHAYFPTVRHLSIGGCRHLLEDGDWVEMGLSISNPTITTKKESYPLKDFIVRHRKTIQDVALDIPGVPGHNSYYYTLYLEGPRLARFWVPNHVIPKGFSAVDSDNKYGWNMGQWASNCEEGYPYCYTTQNARYEYTMFDLEDLM